MASYVLVHGAYHGGWCWRRVLALLRATGCEVHAPTLTGLGERAHLLSPSVGLETHIQDVLGVLVCEDLRDVVLVGHSYGGMVISGVAHHAPERLRCLVYLDALVPEDGQSAMSLFGSGNATSARRRAGERGEGWRMPVGAGPAPYGVSDPADAAWVNARLTPHPLRSFEEPVRLDNPAADALPRCYISCTVGQSDVMAATAARLRANPRWRYVELATGHDAMITAPRELADIVLGL
jgi:pimeloyl-ACP methyl ester carboxylesterase